MKATGFVKQIDDMGRIVIPKEIKKKMDLENRDYLEIFANGDEIILKKYQPGCIFCGEVDNVRSFKNKLICPECLAKLTEM